MSPEFNFEIVPLTEIEQKGLVADHDDHEDRPIVLVVDDEEIILDTRAAIFACWGYTAMKALSAEAAIAIAKLVPPDLLVSDIILSGKNGAELAIEMKALVPNCKVVLLASLGAEAQILAEAKAAGYDLNVIAKPVDPAKLRAHLSALELRPAV
jgi:CheY-like chemotaxis protein